MVAVCNDYGSASCAANDHARLFITPGAEPEMDGPHCRALRRTHAAPWWRCRRAQAGTARTRSRCARDLLRHRIARRIRIAARSAYPHDAEQSARLSARGQRAAPMVRTQPARRVPRAGAARHPRVSSEAHLSKAGSGRFPHSGQIRPNRASRLARAVSPVLPPPLPKARRLHRSTCPLRASSRATPDRLR